MIRQDRMMARIHPTAILEEGVIVGSGSSVWDNVHIRHSTRIGEECIIGEKTHISYSVVIGNRVKINAFVYICTGVTLEDGVMVSAGTVFTNDRFPRATSPSLDRLRSSDPDEQTLPTLVERGATIGAGSIIGCGLTIGAFAMVGMGSVVTKSVLPFHLGNWESGPYCWLCLPVRTTNSEVCSRAILSCGAYSLSGLRFGVHAQRERHSHGTFYGSAVRGPPPMKASSTSAQQRWAVLGGGMLGMTLALELAGQGHHVTLFEGSDRLGGLADAWRLGDVVWDRHYHVTLLSDTALRSLLADLGLEREMKWVTARTGFYSDGRLYSLSSSLDFLNFPPLRLSDKVRLAATILHASRVQDGSKLEGVSVEAWLTTWSGRRTFERIWLPLLRSKLGEDYRRVSAAFIWATIRRLYAARRQGLKQEMFGYVPGGYARILDRLQKRLEQEGIAIRLSSAARSVEPEDGGGVRIAFADGSQERFDSVVLTIPAPAAASLCPALSISRKTAAYRNRLPGNCLRFASVAEAACRLLRYEHHRRRLPFHRRNRDDCFSGPIRICRAYSRLPPKVCCA